LTYQLFSGEVDQYKASLPSLNQVQSFLMSLTNDDKDGRIIIGFTTTVCPIPNASMQHQQFRPYLKYLLLNPTGQFQDIVHEARSVILAGGTMEPVRVPCQYGIFMLDALQEQYLE